MKARHEIYKLIHDEFSHIYCHNCANANKPENCDGCHRKYIGWEPDEMTIHRLITKILDESK